MDNECPQALKEIIVDKHQNKLGILPPHDRRTNPAEKCIDTFKCHFISGISAMDSNFPHPTAVSRYPQHAVHLLPAPPHVFLHAHDGPFDYNAMPMAPSGIRTLVYETFQQLKTWAQHGVDAWYIRYCSDHYLCHKTYVPATRGERISHTVSFFPHDFAVPAKNHQYNVARSIRDLTTALQHRYLQTPLQPVEDKQFDAIQALEQIFCPDLPGTQRPAQTITAQPPVLTTQPRIIPAQPPSVVPAPIQPIVELPTATLPAQLSQLPASVSLSPLSKEHSANNFGRHRYPTRFIVSQKTYSMACTSKYYYSAAHLAKTQRPLYIFMSICIVPS